MATTETKLWDITTDKDRKLHDAITGLLSSLDKLLLDTSPGQPKDFVLRPDTMEKLKNSMAQPLKYPQEPAAFEGLYPKVNFKNLNNVDADVWEETQRLVVRAGQQHTQHFVNNPDKLFNAVYEFHCWIWSMGRDNRPWNECEYYDICEGIVQRNKRDVDDECKRIGRYQGSIKGGLNDVKNTLTSFRTNYVDQQLLEKVGAKYKQPTENAKTKNAPYIQWLPTDATALDGKVENLTKKIAAEDDDEAKEALIALRDKYTAEAASERKLRDDLDKFLSVTTQTNTLLDTAAAAIGVLIEVCERQCTLAAEILSSLESPGFDYLNQRQPAMRQALEGAYKKVLEIVEPANESYCSFGGQPRI